ncbi:MAG TPA: MFS transporter [Paracoccus sp. (in: a-proteobacteria)]|uniref:MFS transporter n=1 Tax=uncultured Paracoccus sp. TaxID=189685 RepID=UPI00261E30A6|nr:MFS transporter [uncultured Paracoccus sp.]HMQ42310.1 MFS transporter [Paracoccus sp. (in: a-proteobacteria)]HMR36936.1 MFS transporter [Paracoccus sp. (in: a-proteobacteria)]
MSARASTFAPFRHSAFRTLWTATLVSNFGGLVQAVSAAWLMTQLTSNATLIALVQASNTLPIMLFALVSGALADIFDRRQIMMAAISFMALMSALLAFVAWTGAITPWVLLAFTFLIGLGQALYNPPWQASMGDLVPREDLPQAVTLNSVGFNLMRSVGPAAGGLIVAAWGAAMGFIVNAFSYIPLMIAMARWKPDYPPRTIAREPFLSAVGAGLRYVALSPNLVQVLSRAGAFGLSAAALMALLPLVAKSHPEGGSLLFGTLLGCFGAGAIIGALTNTRLRATFSNEWVVRLSMVLFAAAMMLVGTTDNLWIHGAAMFPAGLAWVVTLSLFNVTVQLSTPRWVVARALALYQTVTFGGMAAGAWLWGAVAEASGVDQALIGAGVALLAAAALGFVLPMPEFSQSDLSPANRFREPELGLDLRGRSGPIMVMVDYHIAPADTREFLDLMVKRRDIRRRDGARSWVLLRDLEKPDCWSESYHIATWDDYIRHNSRRTVTDTEVYEALRRLHRDEGSPPVHRLIERHDAASHADVPLRGKIDVP